MTDNQQCFVSVDIETDGPLPGLNSMLALGAAVFTFDNPEPRDTFYRTILPLKGSEPDPKTMSWWARQPQAWLEVRKNAIEPKQFASEYLKWLLTLPGKPTFIGWPATFDFSFSHYYLMRFTGQDPFTHAGMCLKTIASMLTNIYYRDTRKKTLPKAWFEGAPKHTHHALDDAVGQGVLFVHMMRELENLLRAKTASVPAPAP